MNIIILALAMTSNSEPRTTYECVQAGGKVIYEYADLPNLGGPFAKSGSKSKEIVGWRCVFSR